MISESKLDNLATQYAYYTLGSSPCEDCDDFTECFINRNKKCKEAEEYHEKYLKLVEEYKNNYGDRYDNKIKWA